VQQRALGRQKQLFPLPLTNKVHILAYFPVARKLLFRKPRLPRISPRQNRKNTISGSPFFKKTPEKHQITIAKISAKKHQ
jgi:aryl-alcohol dehydrogenase-like predicted oxidoreductase